jgi:hypothetical protein
MALRADVIEALVKLPLEEVSMDYVRVHFPLKEQQVCDHKKHPLTDPDDYKEDD